MATFLLALLLLPGVADLYPEGYAATWVFEQGGARIGHHWFTYEGAVSLPGGRAHRFTAGTLLDPGTLGVPAQRFTGELLTDDAGHPLRHVLIAQAGDATSMVEITLAGGNGQARILQGPSKRELPLTVPENAFIQANNFIGYFELLFGLTETGVVEVTLFSSNVLKDFPYRAAPTAEEPAVLQDSLGETITLDEDRRLISLEVAAQGLVVRRTNEILETFTLRPPATLAPRTDFDREEVTIRHGEVSLAGEFTRRRESAGKLPAVLFLSGSGLQDRHGISSGIDVGTHEILDRLTEAGFGVLRMDDRGAGKSTGPLTGLTLDDLVADARACLQTLLAHEHVDPERVVVIGHSEGASTATILAAEFPDLAGIVLMAGMGRPLTEVILEQNAWALAQSGESEEEQARILAEVRNLLTNLDTVEDIPEQYASLVPMKPWLLSHAKQHPLENIRKVTCPVLILQGAADFQVSVERDAQALARALDEAGHEDHELVVFPTLDHLFKQVEGEVSEFADYFRDRRVDEEFLQQLTEWLAGAVTVQDP